MDCHLVRALEEFSGKEGWDKDCKSEDGSGSGSDLRQEMWESGPPGQPVL